MSSYEYTIKVWWKPDCAFMRSIRANFNVANEGCPRKFHFVYSHLPTIQCGRQTPANSGNNDQNDKPITSMDCSTSDHSISVVSVHPVRVVAVPHRFNHGPPAPLLLGQSWSDYGVRRLTAFVCMHTMHPRISQPVCVPFPSSQFICTTSNLAPSIASENYLIPEVGAQ